MNNKYISSLNPATLKEVGKVEATSSSQVNEIVKKAWSAFPEWRDMGLTKRKAILKKIQQQLLSRSEEAEDSDIGPLVSLQQFDKIKRIVEQSRKTGDTIVTGGRPLDNNKGYYFQPTVIVRDASRIQEDMEEVFNPVIYLTSVANDDEAIELANKSKYGLAASVWTGHKYRGQQIARRLRTGTVMINDVIVSFGMAEAGWTGVKQSGIGWVHGEKGFDEMVNIKYINYEPQNHMQKFWWFPYTQ